MRGWIVAIICLSESAFAQGCLDLQSAMERAAALSPEVAIAEADEAMALSDVTAAQSLSRPSLSVFARSAAGDQGLTDNAIENQFGLRASQRVLDFGDARLTRRAAIQGLEARSLEVKGERQSTAFDFSLLLVERSESEEELSAVLDRIEFLQRLRNATAAVLESGGATRLEFLDVAAQLEAAKATALELSFLVDQAETQIETLLGRGHCVRRSVVVDLGNTDAAIEELSETIGLVGPSFELRSRQREIDRNRSELKRAERNRLPVIEVVGVVSYSQDANRNWAYRDRIGVDVSVPLLSGNRLSAQRANSAAMLGRSEAELIRLKRDLDEARSLSRQRVVALTAQLLRQQEALARKEEQFDASEMEFEAGFLLLSEHVEHGLELEQTIRAEVAIRHGLMRERLTLRWLEDRLVPQVTP